VDNAAELTQLTNIADNIHKLGISLSFGMIGLVLALIALVFILHDISSILTSLHFRLEAIHSAIEKGNKSCQ